jgi:glycosyltransferase involved in cell wall biosynthesis
MVSILTPSHQQARWLGQNLKSVAIQTYPNVEQIVMDGGSTDGSVEILKEAQHRLRWSSVSDRGQSHALNKALLQSEGEIIGWLNSDDAYFDKRAVSKAVQVFHERPDVDVVYGHAVLVNAEGLVLHMIWVPPFNHRLLRFYNFIIQPAAFVRRRAVETWIADESYHSAMDRELWLRLASCGRRFHRVNALLAVDRHYPLRKSLARPDLALADSTRLTQSYDLSRAPLWRWRVKLLKVLMRYAGLSLISEGLSQHPALEADTDGAIALLLRQIAIPRGAMPAGG